ncbi:MAG: hypothetical protein DIU61_011570 [Bacteroidota bacterium]|jgi:hypothetical protein|nr:MAG: hypothetical protein DIU61_09080 [Bacteroidota bacterium]
MENSITIRAESFQFKDLEEGHPLQMRTTIPSSKLRSLQKGSRVRIVHENSKLEARLIDDPILVGEGMSGTDNAEITIEVLKADD